MSALEQTVGVAADYRHVEKFARPEPSLALDGTVLKWYDIAPDDAPVPLAIRALARRSLRDAADRTRSASSGELGFVILHRCGESFYFLLVCTWRNENELWETVWAKDGDGDVFFRPWPIEGDAPADVLRVGARRRVPRARRRGRATSAPRATRARGRRTCGSSYAGVV